MDFVLETNNFYLQCARVRVSREVSSKMGKGANLSSLLKYRCLLNRGSFNPLHPNISIHILHTVLDTFPKVLKRRICITIKSFYNW